MGPQGDEITDWNGKSHPRRNGFSVRGEHPETILLVKMGAAGDLVLASPFFDQLRRRFKNSKIVLLTGKTCFPIIRNNPCIDEFLIADDHALYTGRSSDRIRETLRLLFLLRRNRFDRVFVLHRAWQFNLLVALAGIPHRIGFARGNDRHLLTHPVPVVSSRNEREAYLDLLRTLNIPAVYERTFYYLSNEEKKFLDRFCRQNRIRPQTRVIGIAPGGGNNVKNSMPSRRWPASYFIELIRRIHQELPAKVVLFGGPDDRDVVERILKDCPEGLGAVDLSFGEMASVFRRCQVFIGNDSGPLHIATATGIPTISLYGPTDPLQWASPDPHNTVLFKTVECGPCFQNGQFPECDHITCLHSITVDEVWEAVQEKIFLVPARKPSLDLAR